MSLKKSLSLALLLCHFISSSWAEITLDGSLGRSGALSGPDYAITADLGKQIGGNLFHSFRDFNLYQDESATFSGPNTINNIISRVTGGNPSQINGLLRSTIPDAELYLLNPAGIMFGKGAKLDVQGGFHASTANTLRLGDDGEFNASNIEQSILTVAAPSAFGFLKAKPAAITLQDSQLAVPTGKSLSLIGGDLSISGKPVEINNLDDIDNLEYSFSSRIYSESGQFNIASVASPGEVTFTEASLNLSEQTQRGAITINQTEIFLSGKEGGGSAFIRGGDFKLINSDLTSETLGSKDGKVISIKVDQLELQGGFALAPNYPSLFGLYTPSSGAGKAGDIEIEARQIKLTNNAVISSSTAGIGNGGNITIKVAEVLTLSNSSGIFAAQINSKINNSGDAGKIMLKAQQIVLTDNSVITSGTLGTGKSGSITLSTDMLTVQSGNIHSRSMGTGDAGEVKIATRQLILSEGGQIGSDTFSIGKGGLVTIKADNLIFSGYEKISDTDYFASGIYASSLSKEANSGESGNINIQVYRLKLTDGAQISSSNHGSGKGGTINIKADELIISKKISEQFRSGIFAQSSNGENYAGDAGDITVEANKINLIDGGEITTSANNAGGGDINITVPNSLYLQAGAITTDVKNGQGNGGEIHIHKPVLAILNNSEILTKADQGWGGGIDITADKFIPSVDSLLDASSRVEGRSGEIKIEADSYVGNGLITLPESFSNPPSLRRCETQFTTQETPSHFTRANRARMRRDELKEGVWGSPLDF